MNQTLKVGIAGYGIVGKRRRYFIDRHPHLKTVAVCDKKFPGEGHLEDGIPSFQNYESLLKNVDLDILFVCLTNDVAPDAVIAGLKKGLHVFCEKPPGRNTSDILRVIEQEKQNKKLKLMYGFNHRYHDSVKEAVRIVNDGSLGKVLNLRGIYGKSKIISFESDWRTKRAIAGGGILLDQGIHMVDLMRLFAGEFKEIYSFISNSFWHHDVEDNAYALLRTEGGIIGMLHSSATQWRHRFQLEITLQKGQIILAGILSGSKSYGSETITIAYANENDGGDPLEIMKRFNEDNSWRDEINDFAVAVLSDKPIESGSSLEALKTMELVYRIYCADKEWSQRYNIEGKDYE